MIRARRRFLMVGGGVIATLGFPRAPRAAQVTALSSNPPTFEGITFPTTTEGPGYAVTFPTDANGNPPTSRPSSSSAGSGTASDETVRNTQSALNARGYDAGAVDGLWGPNTQSALRRFQTDRGLAPTGMIDDETRTALGVAQ